MNFALSEEAFHKMTQAPQVNRSNVPEPITIKTPAENREIAPTVNLHREADAKRAQDQKEDASATQEVIASCTQACKGMVYDARHWKNLPGDSNYEKFNIVMCRGGRLPYLLLTFSVGFFTFFLVFRLVSSKPKVAPAAMPSPPKNMLVGPPL